MITIKRLYRMILRLVVGDQIIAWMLDFVMHKRLELMRMEDSEVILHHQSGEHEFDIFQDVILLNEGSYDR